MRTSMRNNRTGTRRDMSGRIVEVELKGGPSYSLSQPLSCLPQSELSCPTQSCCVFEGDMLDRENDRLLALSKDHRLEAVSSRSE